MCGRYNFSTEEAEELQKIVREVNDQLRDQQVKTGEVFPTNLAPVLVEEQGQPVPRAMTWGFPHWQKSGVIINARCETVTERKMFREAVLTRRCLVPCSGFFEWEKNEDGSKTKLLFRQPGSPVLYMAGFWSAYKEQDGEQRERFVILTTAANDSMLSQCGTLSLFPQEKTRMIHDRMPVILAATEREEWLSGNADFGKLFDRSKTRLEQSIA